MPLNHRPVNRLEIRFAKLFHPFWSTWLETASRESRVSSRINNLSGHFSICSSFAMQKLLIGKRALELSFQMG